jgi:hypothetical protein
LFGTCWQNNIQFGRWFSGTTLSLIGHNIQKLDPLAGLGVLMLDFGSGAITDWGPPPPTSVGILLLCVDLRLLLTSKINQGGFKKCGYAGTFFELVP